MAPSHELIGRVKRRLRAFSLMELAITLGMVAILGALVVTSLTSIQKRSMVRQQLEVARGSMYEWRDKSRNAHMIGCIKTANLGTNDFEVEFYMLESGDCMNPGSVLAGSQSSFKITGVRTLISKHLDARGNVFEQTTQGWQGSFTKDGSPGGFVGVLTGLQPQSVYLAQSSQEILVAGQCGSTSTEISAEMKIMQDSSGGIHVVNSQG